ncbi:hypothetical protein ACWCPS_31255 [Streptomyces mauvecolor]
MFEQKLPVAPQRPQVLPVPRPVGGRAWGRGVDQAERTFHVTFRVEVTGKLS